MREVNGVWFRNTAGNQFLKVAMPKDAISLQATVKTASGIHKMTIDRWGDATHKYDHYNSRRHPSSRDQMAIRRYEADKAVMDPLPSPIPVIRKRNSTRYWLSPREEELENIEAGRMWQSHKHPNSRKERRRSPYYPLSPKYPGPSSEEEEVQQQAGPHPPEMAHDPQDPWAISDNGTENEAEESVPDLVSFNQIDGQVNEEDIPTGRPKTSNGTPPKKLKDFLKSTEEFDQALDEAIQIVKEYEEESVPLQPLKMAKMVIEVTPNKVVHMEGPDTKFANPGRHRNKVEYNRAEINQVVLLESPDSSEPEDKEATETKALNRRMSPCLCSQPETCTSEATTTTAGDSGHDSEDQE